MPVIASRTGSGAGGAFGRLGGAGDAVSSALPAAATLLWAGGDGEASFAGLTALAGGTAGGAVPLVRSAETFGASGLAGVGAGALPLPGALTEARAELVAGLFAGLVTGLLAE